MRFILLNLVVQGTVYSFLPQLSVPLLINYFTTAGPTKVGNAKENSTACPSMVEIPKNSVNLKEELKAETEDDDQIKPKKLGTISLSTAFSSEDSDSEVEAEKKKISNMSKLVPSSSEDSDSEVEGNKKKSDKSKLVEDSSSSEDSDSEDSDRKKSNMSKLVKDSSSSRDLNTSFDIKCEPLDEFVDEESLLIDLILKGTYKCNFLNIFWGCKILWTEMGTKTVCKTALRKFTLLFKFFLHNKENAGTFFYFDSFYSV